MRYPRLFVVWFVALGLAASPAAIARADHPGARLSEPVYESVNDAVLGADPVRWSGVVDALAAATELDERQAGELLNAVGEAVLTIANAGQRAGVLAVPEADQLIDGILGLATTSEPSEETTDLGEPRGEVGGVPQDGMLATQALMGEPAEQSVVDPVERWRSLVERYFDEDRVAEALSIIGCESNGDPSITNPRSSAAGLFQFISGTWDTASEHAGFGGASALDPEANVAAAAWLVEYSLTAGQSAWAHWTCRP